MSWRPSPVPIDAPVAKLGGRPFWLAEPFWPVRPDTGEQLMFVGQFPLPGPQLRLSYLFVADDDLGLAATFELEGGENALLIQPGGRVPPFVTGIAAATGPALWRHGRQWADHLPVELHVDFSAPSAAATAAYDWEVARQDAARRGVLFERDDTHDVADCRSYLGGEPLFWQPWTADVDQAWRFFFQLDGDETDYALNFGGGTGFAFLSEDQLEGRFFWDCV